MPLDDRMQLRIATVEGDEIRVWLTRRFLIGVLPVLERCTEDHAARRLQQTKTSYAASDAYVRKSLAEFASAKHLEKADFQTPFNAAPRNVLLAGETMLPMEAQLTPQANGVTTLVLKNEQLMLTFELNEQLLHALVRLLHEALPHSDWGVAVTLPQQQIAPREARLLN